jgi:hypothetical protein
LPRGDAGAVPVHVPVGAHVGHHPARLRLSRRAWDRFSAAFRIGEWWRILWANKLGYFVAFVVTTGILGVAYWAFMILYSTMVLLCLAFLVLVPTGMYAMLVGAALFGDAYRDGTESLRKRTEATPGTTSA